jgi:outer membrane protein
MVPKSSPVLAAALALTLAAAALPAPVLAQDGAMKIAVIDVQRIITESGTGKAVLAKLEEFGKQQQDKLKAKRDAVEQLRTRLSEGQLSLADDKLAELQKEIESKTIDLRRASDDAQREFNRRQEEELKGIERKVMPIIEQVGREGGYTMIFRKFESGLVFATDDIDITQSIILKLDAAPLGG